MGKFFLQCIYVIERIRMKAMSIISSSHGKFTQKKKHTNQMLSIPSLCMTFTTFTQIIDEATLGKLFSSASQIRFGLHLFINYFKIIWPPF